jgi:uncharacterized membrane protein
VWRWLISIFSREENHMDAFDSNQHAVPSLDQTRRGARAANIGEIERWASLVLGGGLLAFGLKRDVRERLPLAIVVGALLYRGITRRCPLFKALGIDTSAHRPRPAVSVPHGRGVKVENSILIDKPAGELYSFWRNFENLPRFMSHLVSVQSLDDKRSRWVARSIGGTEVSWEAENINEIPNELIAWRTVEGSDVDHAGSVRFEQTNRGTVVRVTLEYRPPVGKLGLGLAKIAGQEPQQVIEADLRRFKRLMESGEVVSVQGQPLGNA